MTPSRRPLSVRLRRSALAAVATLAAGTLVAAGSTTPAAAGSDPGPGTAGRILGADSPTAVPGSYLVVLDDTAVGGRAGTGQRTVSTLATEITARFGIRPDQVWGDALNGFAVRTTETVARRIAAHPAVAHVEADQTVQLASVTQYNPPWHLDRLDAVVGQDTTYTYERDGTGTWAYVLDAGVRTTHVEFGGQAYFGWNAGGVQPPCHSVHGTHTAALIAGTTYGVAKDAVVVDVRVSPTCNGSASWADVIGGLNWVAGHHLAGVPAVATLALGGAVNASVNAAVANLVADGVSVVVAAGNGNVDACNFSPGSAPTAITMGTTMANDSRASFSNYGPCLDLFGPGVNITSASNTSDTAVATLNGTSQSTGQAAGVVARVLEANPTWSPAQVVAYLTAVANPVVTNPGPGSPNRLLHAPPSL